MLAQRTPRRGEAASKSACSLADQAEELRARIGLRGQPERFFTRRSQCDGLLADLSRDEVAGRVPPFVEAHSERFRGFTDCGRVDRVGSHVARIPARLRVLFPILS